MKLRREIEESSRDGTMPFYTTRKPNIARMVVALHVLKYQKAQLFVKSMTSFQPLKVFEIFGGFVLEGVSIWHRRLWYLFARFGAIPSYELIPKVYKYHVSRKNGEISFPSNTNSCIRRYRHTPRHTCTSGWVFGKLSIQRRAHDGYGLDSFQ